MSDLPTIEVIKTLDLKSKRKNTKIHNQGYTQGARHMIADIIRHLEKTIDIQSLDYLREQEKKIPRD